MEETQEKKKGLNCIMGHMSGKGQLGLPEAMLKGTAVLRLDVEQNVERKNRFRRL
ncbi:MAG: hypothetical protein ACLTDI_13520 [Acutalibacteraceae bacterium]